MKKRGILKPEACRDAVCWQHYLRSSRCLTQDNPGRSFWACAGFAAPATTAFAAENLTPGCAKIRSTLNKSDWNGNRYQKAIAPIATFTLDFVPFSGKTDIFTN
ncbi:hypothetical protein [Botryobacter ruber]|uniref:hypothetical protein n=1 Tax=Botryobacter ruber TaxID=2171629 RepID=UPI000FEC8AE5|nr:hypothetical protein [Botryobacter ruber]